MGWELAQPQGLYVSPREGHEALEVLKAVDRGVKPE